MKVTPSELPDVLIIEPRIFADERGFFYESYNEKAFIEGANITDHFVQDNHSRSINNVLRGLHYQIFQPQGKLVRVTRGEVYDVVVDLRRGSPRFGKWTAVTLSAENKRMLWVPVGFAHGFLVTGDYAEFQYKATNYWAPQFERCIRWDDPDLAIPWPYENVPRISAKDAAAPLFKDAEVFE